MCGPAGNPVLIDVALAEGHVLAEDHRFVVADDFDAGEAGQRIDLAAEVSGEVFADLGEQGAILFSRGRGLLGADCG